MATSKSPVFVTGATGYIALRIIDILLTKGYPVIGTMRSASKGDSLITKFGARHSGADFSYEIVSDIAGDGAFDEALKAHPEIKYVLHTASPVELPDTTWEEGYIKPAVNGTLNVLKGIKAHAPQVEKVVVTSSNSAKINKGADPRTFVHTEETWNPVQPGVELTEENAYNASKTFAERAAWAFVQDEKPNFSLTTVTPPYVFGPQVFTDSLQNETLNFSAELVNSLLKTTPADDETDLPYAGLSIDVRDVALIHVLVLENDALVGNRLYPVQGQWSQQEFLTIINEKFPELQGKIARGRPEKASGIREKLQAYDNTKTKTLSGIDWIPTEQTVIDTVKQILDYKKTST